MAEERGDAGAVDRRRHDEEPQILAQPLLHVARQREAEIGIERALVEFVEQDGGDPVEHRVVEHEPREHALGDDFDPRAPRHLRAEAHPQADRVADALAERLRHPLRRRARGEPPRLEDENAAVLRPWFLGEHEWHSCRLAGAGRGDQHGGVAARATPRSVPAARRRWAAATRSARYSQ